MQLLDSHPEFRALWQEHEVGIRPKEIKRYQHPVVGLLELSCQVLLDPEQSHSLLVYTAVPGSESHEKLQLLAVVGAPTTLTAPADGDRAGSAATEGGDGRQTRLPAVGGVDVERGYVERE